MTWTNKQTDIRVHTSYFKEKLHFQKEPSLILTDKYLMYSIAFLRMADLLSLACSPATMFFSSTILSEKEVEYTYTSTGIYILAILSKLKNRDEFEGGLHDKKKGKGGKKKKEKSDKIHVKYLYEAQMTAKNPQKRVEF